MYANGSSYNDILSRHNTNNPVAPESIVNMFNDALENWNTDLRSIVKSMIKIYAHADGSFDLNIGVHITGCGGLQHILPEILFYFNYTAQI